MENYNRLISLIISAILLAFLAACSSLDTDSSVDESNADQAVAITSSPDSSDAADTPSRTGSTDILNDITPQEVNVCHPNLQRCVSGMSSWCCRMDQTCGTPSTGYCRNRP